MNALRTLATAIVCMMSLAASAQWQWIDKDGRKAFSDRAPPADIQEKDILKRPGVRAAASRPPADAAANVETQAPAAAPQTAASAPKISGVDKDLQEKKKKADEAEAAKRKDEEDKAAKARADNCTRANQAKANLASGMRIAQTNSKGEREVMDDAARAMEVKRVQSVIESDCK